MRRAPRTFADWAGALPQCKRKGRELVGPCPLCGGFDRFHVTRLRDGGALVGCRGCIDGRSTVVRRERFLRIVKEVFGDTREQPNPFLPPPKRARSQPPQRNAQRMLLAKRLWDAGLPLVGPPGRTYLARRRIWPNLAEAVALPDESLRWLPAASLQRFLPRKRREDGSWICPLPASAAGCLAYAFRTEHGALTAVALEALTAEGRFPPEARFRRTYGSRRGSFFTPERRNGDAAVVVCEGELDALAGATLGRIGERTFAGAEVRAYGGTSNLVEARLPENRPILIVSDGDPAGWHSAQSLRERYQAARILWLSGRADLASLLAESIEERIGVYEHEAGMRSGEAERQAWATVGLLDCAGSLYGAATAA